MIRRRGKNIVPITSYAPATPLRIAPKPPPTIDDKIRALEAKIVRLEHTLELAKDRLRRHREVIESEVRFWDRGLKEGQWEGMEAARRRLSRLRGALEYPGVRGWAGDEKV